jgi:ribokinase
MSGEDGVEAGVRRLAAETGCRVVATLGADGALVCADGALLRVDAVRVEALDTTGAGDAFNGALAVGLAAGLPLVDAVEGANTAAAYATTALGAQGGMLTRAELRARLRRPELQDAWR